MSEKMFTQSEVEKALDIMLYTGVTELNEEELSKKLEGMSKELKALIAAKLTMVFIELMRTRMQQAKKHNNPIAEFLDRLKDNEECACSKYSCKNEDPEVHIFKNGKPATSEDKSELFNLFKMMLDKD